MSNWINLKVFGVIAAALYAISWPLSLGMVYSYHTENTYLQQNNTTIQDVDIKVWLKSTSSSWARSWICPLIMTGKSEGPYTIVVRLDDPHMKAKKYRINSAQLTESDGTVLPLRMATEHPEHREKPWYPFFKNASAWIGHVYHDGSVVLSGKVTVKLDLTIEKDSVEQQEVFSIRMKPTIKQRQGLSIR